MKGKRDIIMRFLHTADLHLGRRLSDLSLLDDQKVLLGQIIDTAVSEKADGVIIAGDVYNKSVPGSDAMMLLDDFLTQLAENNISIYMISGNHDSSERISYFSQLVFQRSMGRSKVYAIFILQHRKRRECI